ncbi:hypothetical protein QI349_02760 [Staphylococcus saprophyticus]|nr:hypothetical protein [Staphylococcus saprophyticus]
MKETNLSIEDIIRIKAIALDSNYPDDLVNKIVDGLNCLFEKAQEFDNYIADLAKTMEEYPPDYDKYGNFAKETYEFYMKSKEDFIKAYEKEVGHKHELIRDVAEYDELVNKMEVNDEKQ